MNMKINIIYLLLIALLGIAVFTSIAQQNQNAPKTDTEVEALRKRVSELENKLQIVENVEKMELAAKLAEAQAKLANAEFGKLKLELKDSNQQWLITWIIVFLAFLSAGGLALWSRLTKKMDDLIATEVEKRVNTFQEAVEEVDTLKFDLKEAVGQVSILQGQLRILNKEHAVSVLENYMYHPPEEYPEQIKQLPEQALLDAFNDETRHLQFRCKAAEVLANDKSAGLISPVLKCLDSYINSDFDWDDNYHIQHLLCDLLHYIGYVHTTETYEAFERFLERLLIDNPEVKRFIIKSITFSLAYVSSELNKKESASIIRKAIPALNIDSEDEDALRDLARYFDKIKEYDATKEMLEHHGTAMNSDVKETCLALLEKHDREFVEKYRAVETTTNTESEETDESEPTE